MKSEPNNFKTKMAVISPVRQLFCCCVFGGCFLLCIRIFDNSALAYMATWAPHGP